MCVCVGGGVGPLAEMLFSAPQICSNIFRLPKQNIPLTRHGFFASCALLDVYSFAVSVLLSCSLDRLIRRLQERMTKENPGLKIIRFVKDTFARVAPEKLRKIVVRGCVMLFFVRGCVMPLP